MNLFIYMNNKPTFNISFFNPSSEQCYYVVLSHPKNYFQMKKEMKKLENS